MSLPDHSIIDESWLSEDLEEIDACPYCGSLDRNMAHQDVQDWSFYCAPGKWTYWSCGDCGALYLNPRPTKQSIGRAYTNYYTHGESKVSKVISFSKSLLRNLCYLAWYGIELRPRIAMPKFLFPLLSVFRNRIAAPSFILQALHQLPKGRVVDVGCGNGMFLDVAKQFGWSTLGIELDPAAAKVVRAMGHEVIQGTYEALAVFDHEIDCIICSHVLEHVHDPKALFRAMSDALKPGGVILLSLPNAGSIVRSAVSDNWRGLEAPRHLVIPRYEGLLEAARLFGFEKKYSTISRLETLDASLLIAQRRGADTRALRVGLARLQVDKDGVTEVNSDFINVVLRKVAESTSQSKHQSHHGISLVDL